MNDDLAAVLFDVVERQERHILADEYLAIAALDGERRLILSDYDYLRDRAAAVAFEQRVAAHGRRVAAVRWVLAVPQVWVINERDVAARSPSPHPLRADEEECVTWMGFDQEDGIDYGLVPYARRPSGQPVFDEPKVFNVPLIPGDLMPGHTLLRAFLDDESSADY
ncbi:hypothetical protein E1264_09270 [Actinomadura sp. KC216]|uniref:hypothetical protein n=1 Tax=Actinomadura sp. KC216 TaxID=2530370 RepID=UPI001046A593|nr:hypothetical protein [Actinomadura sp. KC216]TDB89151.1 hypothetical protein E1264_09270 [Actinomadura sp. KC216]